MEGDLLSRNYIQTTHYLNIDIVIQTFVYTVPLSIDSSHSWIWAYKMAIYEILYIFNVFSLISVKWMYVNDKNILK